MLLLLLTLLIYIKVQTAHTITFTMTTCNRLNLTSRTLSSLKNHGYNIDGMLIMVDCYNQSFVDAISTRFPEVVLVEPSRTSEKASDRLMINIQELSDMVVGRWWFHCEDDWEFTRGGFLQDSLQVLNGWMCPDELYMIMGRQANSFKPHVDNQWVGPIGSLRVNAGPGGAFTSYTANPALIDMDKARKFIGRFDDYRSESHISRTLGSMIVPKRVGIFNDRFYYSHIGYGKTSMRDH